MLLGQVVQSSIIKLIKDYWEYFLFQSWNIYIDKFYCFSFGFVIILVLTDFHQLHPGLYS